MADLRECETHGKQCWFCTAHKKAERGGSPCTSHIPEHAKVCKWHGGNSANAKKGQADREQMAAILEQARVLGVKVETTPEEALLNQVWETAGNVELYRSLVAQLALHPGEETVDEDGYLSSSQAAIYGRTGNERIVNEAAPHILVRMYDAERDRLVKVAKACADVGISERLVRIAEQQGELMVRIFEASLEDPEWGLSKVAQAKGRTVISRHLRLVG